LKALDLSGNTKLIQSDHRDPMLMQSRLPLLRSFAVAFDHTDISAIGGNGALTQMLIAWGCGRSWELSEAFFEDKKFVRVVFTSIADAETLFQRALNSFSRFYCLGPGTAGGHFIQPPPLPTLWKGGPNNAGFWSEEFPGLVEWDMPHQPQEAMTIIRQRILDRLDCQTKHLPLFVDPQMVCTRQWPSASEFLTRVKVFAHHRSTARRIATDRSGTEDPEIMRASVSSGRGCHICGERPHAAWECPRPKIRIRLTKPFNSTVKALLRSFIFDRLGNSDVLLQVWGGRFPQRNQQNKRFGYLAFTSESSRDLAFDLLSTPWHGAAALMQPILKVDGPLWAECAVCGCSEREPTAYNIKVHRLDLHSCPNMPRVSDLSFSVDITAVNWQIPQFSANPPASQGARY